MTLPSWVALAVALTIVAHLYLAPPLIEWKHHRIGLVLIIWSIALCLIVLMTMRP